MNAEVSELVIGAEPAAWQRVGLPSEEGVAELGGIRLVFDPARRGIASIGVVGFAGDADAMTAAFDGLPVHPASPAIGVTTVNEMSAVAVELISIASSSAERTTRALEAVTGRPGSGVGLHKGMVMGYSPLGATQAEVLEDAAAPAEAVTVGGMILIVTDIDALSARLGPDLLSVPRRAVQYGRRISAFRPAADLGAPIAVMTPAPPQKPAPHEVEEWRELRAAERRG